MINDLISINDDQIYCLSLQENLNSEINGQIPHIEFLSE